MKQPRYYRYEEFEGKAQALLSQYHRQFPTTPVTEIPVDEIIESLLGLDLVYDDLARLFACKDILGAINIHEKAIFVDASLMPERHPSREGRFRFTLAHELGHWVLHRFDVAPKEQGSLFRDEGTGHILCRKATRYEQREWQANQFAACLLMPSVQVHAGWLAVTGSADPLTVAPNELLNRRWALGEDFLPAHPVAREMAGIFRVSNQAMQIRLERIGLFVAADAVSLSV
jgi:hypothetical protein